MEQSINLQIARLLGWTVTKVAINDQGHPNTYLNHRHPKYEECLERNGCKYSVNITDKYYSSATRKLSSGYNDIWFDTEDNAWIWLSGNVWFDSDLDQAMTLFVETGITVSLSQPADNLKHYSASVSNHPVKFPNDLYSVSEECWAEAVCMCWLKFKVETES